MKQTYPNQWGFLLFELALALAILTLAVVPLVRLEHTLRESRNEAERLAQARRVLGALEGFVMAHARLPCPAAEDDPNEQRTDQQCDQATGPLPAATLGLPLDDHAYWQLTVATLETLGPPAEHALFRNAESQTLNQQTLMQLIYQPPTPNHDLQGAALPAIHLCQKTSNQTLPALNVRSCGHHSLHSASLVAALYPTNDPLNRNRVHQVFFSQEQPRGSLLWLSVEHFIWLKNQAGWMPAPN